MDNITDYNVSGGISVSKALASNTAAAASNTISIDGRKVVVRINNADAAVDAVAHVAAGDGIRSSLGVLDVTCEHGNVTYIPLYDTARHMALDTKLVTITLTDGNGDALEEGVISDITMEAITVA